MEFTLLRPSKKLEVEKTLQNLVDVFDMIFFIMGKDEDIIQVSRIKIGSKTL